MSESLAETPQPTALVNSVVKNLCALAARAWSKRWIITFTAPTGVGETTAVDYAERERQDNLCDTNYEQL